ncbi:AAA family ATPase [Sphingomonas sp.]|uniref:AAA family ATPase n=2 Tax=unclassified Sphingomonas TaxID=196159 RepID=UPI0025E0B535|nr:AAA family ATPase [Sphingomonas sp.]
MATVHSNAAPSWNGFRVTTFAGQHDSHIDTGEDYRTITLASIFESKPQAKPKMAGNAFLASSYHNYDARSHEAQRAHGSFVALVGDIDKGNLALAAIQSAAEAFSDGSAWLVYSSAHSRDGDQRWRIVFPLDEPCQFEQWFDAQTALFTFMEASGIPMDHALSRAGQPIYLPNVPAAYKDGTPLRDEAGEPIYYQSAHSGLDAVGLDLRRGIVAGGIASLRQKRAADDREREALKAEAAKRYAAKPRQDGANIIETFNASTSVETMLALCDYQQSPRNGDDWRSPQQAGDTYATRVIDGKWISLSASDAASGLGSKCKSGCFGDAYDLYVHYKHGGDHKEAYRTLGREQRGANVVQGNFRGHEQDPGYQEMPDWVQSGDAEPDYDLDIVEEVAAEKASSGKLLPLEWFDQIDAQLDANWLVDDLIPSQGLCLVYGHPGCGKSFFALDMAMHVAGGQAWRDRDVEQGLVIYIGAEGQRGLRQRVAAFRKHHDVKDLPFALIPVEINLLADDGDLNALIDTIKEAAKRYNLPIAMIVVDTLARTFGGGDEIGSDMVAYINNVGRLQAMFACTTMVIHHRPKDSTNETPRGHGSLWGACDTIILVEDKGGPKQAKVTKQKDAEPAPPVVFELRVVELGEDEKGRPVTSCVVVGSDSKILQDKKADTLSDGQRITFETLCRTLADTGSTRGHDVPEKALTFGFETRVCRLSEWVSRTTSALSDPDKSPDTIARTIRRYRDRLQALGIVGVYGDFAWRIK